MHPTRVDVYRDAFWYYVPFKYVGLSVYSLPRDHHQQPSVKATDVFLTIVLFVCISSCYGLIHTDCQKLIDSSLFKLIFNTLDLQVFFVAINAHFRSKSLMDVFRTLDTADKKIALINGAASFKMAKERVLQIATLLRYATIAATLILDIVCVIITKVGLVSLLCSSNRYVATIWRIQGGCLYTFFVAECTRRLKHVNESIRSMLLKKEMRCIETHMSQKLRVGYKMEEARLAVCQILNVVTKANQVFEVQMLLKVWQIFLVVLILLYYVADTYFFNETLTQSQSTLYLLYLLTHSVLYCVDLFVDIWFYRSFEDEVSDNVDASFA